VLAVVAGGGLSWFASTVPDGLEWSIGKITGKEELPEQGHGVPSALKKMQQKIAVLPDYGFKPPEGSEAGPPGETPAWPAVDAGTTVSGLVGGILVLGTAMAIGWAIRAFRRRRAG
jgi:cobalt/nickel transport system permease protein